MDFVLLMNKWLNNAVVGVLLGILLATLTDWARRRGQRKTHRAAIAEEIEICREFAEEFRTRGVLAPAYRLPVTTYIHGFPKLLVDGGLDSEKARALILFFNEAETINRLLDQATNILYQPSDAASAKGQQNENLPADFGTLTSEQEKTLEGQGFQLVSGYEFLPPEDISPKQWREYKRTLLKIRRLGEELYPPARDAVAPKPYWRVHAWFQLGP